MQDIFERVKDFCLEYKRYIGAFILFIAFIVVLDFCEGMEAVSMNSNKNREESQSVTDAGTEQEKESESETETPFEFQENYDVDTDGKITALISEYYQAYVQNDIEKLEKLAHPISENEKSYIAVVSKYYDKIDKFTCYSKPAEQSGAYFVSVENHITFDGIKTSAPALDFFYIETDENGDRFINNAYSIFNLNFMDNKVDSNVYAMVQKYMQQTDFIQLQQRVQSAYDEALSKDSDLAGVIQKTLDSAIKKWTEEMQSGALKQEESEVKDADEKSEEEQTNDTTTVAEPEQNTTDSQETADKPAASENKKTTVRTKDVVNVRKEASVDSQQLGQFSADAELTKIGTEGDWTIIEFQGGKGYVKSEFLK